jgi:hypothetical protein
VDELAGGVSENSCYTMGYTEATATLIRRDFLNTTLELLEEALGIVCV